MRKVGYKDLVTGEGAIVIEVEPLYLKSNVGTVPQEIQLYDEWRSAANWRRTQLSDDVFDKFRNLYLIVERIGKKIRGSNNLT